MDFQPGTLIFGSPISTAEAWVPGHTILRLSGQISSFSEEGLKQSQEFFKDLISTVGYDGASASHLVSADVPQAPEPAAVCILLKQVFSVQFEGSQAHISVQRDILKPWQAEVKTPLVAQLT